MQNQIPKPKANFWSKLKELVHKGNIYNLIIEKRNSQIILNIPMNIVIIAVLFSPIIVGAGLLFAIIKDCSLRISEK